MLDPNRPNVYQVVAVAREYYSVPGNAVGGSLHIVLDDGNLGDSDIEWCLGEAFRNDDQAGVFLAYILLQLSSTQRRKVRALR